MIKLTKAQKSLTVAGAAVKKMTKTAYFENILSTQMFGNNIKNGLNLISQIIYYSNPNNRRMSPNNFITSNRYIRSGATGYTSTINMG